MKYLKSRLLIPVLLAVTIGFIITIALVYFGENSSHRVNDYTFTNNANCPIPKQFNNLESIPGNIATICTGDNLGYPLKFLHPDMSMLANLSPSAIKSNQGVIITNVNSRLEIGRFIADVAIWSGVSLVGLIVLNKLLSIARKR